MAILARLITIETRTFAITPHQSRSAEESGQAWTDRQCGVLFRIYDVLFEQIEGIPMLFSHVGQDAGYYCLTAGCTERRSGLMVMLNGDTYVPFLMKMLANPTARHSRRRPSGRSLPNGSLPCDDSRHQCRRCELWSGTGTGFGERLEPEFPRNCRLIDVASVCRTRRIGVRHQVGITQDLSGGTDILQAERERGRPTAALGRPQCTYGGASAAGSVEPSNPLREPVFDRREIRRRESL
jgi:hypothetical protein